MKCPTCQQPITDVKVYVGYEKRPIMNCCTCLGRYAIEDDGFVVELTEWNNLTKEVTNEFDRPIRVCSLSESCWY